jgi:hypothetical protein
MARSMAHPRHALVLSSVMGIALAGLVLAGCGGADFSGGAVAKARSGDATGGDDSGPQDPPSEETPSLPEPYAALTWYWQCATDPVEPPAPGSDKEVVVTNEGPHTFPEGSLNGTPIVFSGQLCPPAELPRDIVFVIDTSGSNESEGTDPRRVLADRGCGRLDAIKQVMASIPAGQANFGLNTFSGGTDAKSSAMFGTEAELFADVVAAAGAADISDVVCAANGGTNYNAGLDQAGATLRGGRADALKEIYFISDGAPTSGDGIALANSLKTIGVNIGTEFLPVTIATVMLQGTSTTAKDTEIKKLSSIDSNGQLLHATAMTADDLAVVLTELSKNELVSGELKYRPIGSADWTTLDVIDHMSDFNFTLPSFSIDLDQAPQGLEVLFEYRDMHDNEYATGGKLLWQSAEAESDTN